MEAKGKRKAQWRSKHGGFIQGDLELEKRHFPVSQGGGRLVLAFLLTDSESLIK